MATPVGHYLLGLSVTQILSKDRQERRRGVGLALIACVPDLDVIPGILVGNLAQFHHSVSHSFFAAVIFSLLGFGALWWRGWKLSHSLFLLLFLLYVSHLILDFFTLDPGEPQGIPLFWPWKETYQSPWALLPNVQHTRGPLLSAHNLFLMVREALVFLPLIGLVYSFKSSPWRSSYAAAWLFGAWFIVAVSASFLSFHGR